MLFCVRCLLGRLENSHLTADRSLRSHPNDNAPGVQQHVISCSEPPPACNHGQTSRDGTWPTTLFADPRAESPLQSLLCKLLC